jgi:hypothetical protein
MPWLCIDVDEAELTSPPNVPPRSVPSAFGTNRTNLMGR